MRDMTRRLSEEDENAVRDTIGALEIAEGVVPAAALPALSDPAVHAAVVDRLQSCGRVLNSVGDGWTSGYDDQVADTLAHNGTGTLVPSDRAVLALVLLRCVAVPRARGAAPGISWADSAGMRPTSLDELEQNRNLDKTTIKRSLQRLQANGLVKRSPRGGITPGPALHRLTPRRTAELWEDLLILAAPESTYARVLRERRAGAATSPTTKDSM